MEWKIAAGILILVFVIAILKRPKQQETSYPQYRIKKKLFTSAERSFLGVLSKAVGQKFTILGKIRIADILTPTKTINRSAWQSAFNKINAKHFDYVLCDPDTLSVHCVIELNDKSHKEIHRAKRDEFVREICKSAGLRLIEVQAKRSYSINEIENLILPTPKQIKA